MPSQLFASIAGRVTVRNDATAVENAAAALVKAAGQMVTDAKALDPGDLAELARWAGTVLALVTAALKPFLPEATPT